ncbi:unnamed protein product [Closterium sp. NIES-54]
MVDPVVDAGVADTLEARLDDARRRHTNGEYGTIPLVIAELGIRSQWATEHPSRPTSPRPVRNKCGVDDEVDGGARVSGSKGTRQRGVIKVGGGVDGIHARVQWSTAAAGGSRADVDVRRRSPPRRVGGLSVTTHVTAGGIAPAYGYFKFSPDRIAVAPLQGRRDLITWRGSIEPQLEVARLKGFADGTVPFPPKEDVELRGEFRSAHLLTFMVISSSRESLDEDSLTSYILQDEAMQEAEQPTEFLPQASYAAPTKPNSQQEQRGKLGGGGSGSGRSTKDVNEKRSTRDKDRRGGGRRRECWICGDPDHLSFECPDRDDSDEDDNKEGRGRSVSRRPCRVEKPRKEKQASKTTFSTKDVDSSSGKSRGNGEASCSMVGVVEPTVSLAPEAGEDFQAVAAALARHTFPAKGSDAAEALAVVHIDLCGPFRVAAKDGSIYFLLPKDRHTRFVWAMPVARKSDVLREFKRWLVLVERQTKKSVLLLCSDRGGEFLGKAFTDFIDGKGIVHDLTCPYTPQQNGMAEREMRTAVESVRTMLLHMGVQHHWWHLTLPQAV